MKKKENSSYTAHHDKNIYLLYACTYMKVSARVFFCKGTVRRSHFQLTTFESECRSS